MTSDAKIGLLLGLVFIFIIAFIINGLPRLRSEPDSNELTTNMVKNEPPGLGAVERRAEQVLDSPPAGPVPPAEQGHSLLGPTYIFSGDAGGHVRDTQLLPGSPLVADGSAEYGLAPPQSETLGPVEAAGAEPAGQVGPGPAGPPKLDEARESDWPKKYLVASGDTLASIAKKFYGPVDGNKRANVARIFEANRGVLKSPDRIKVGQQLVIPALPAKAADKPEDEGLFSSELFEKVRSMGLIKAQKSAPEQEGRFYVVKQGDCLWNIAAEQLGDGARYREISKLNSDILADEDELRVGLRLKLPVR